MDDKAVCTIEARLKDRRSVTSVGFRCWNSHLSATGWKFQVPHQQLTLAVAQGTSPPHGYSTEVPHDSPGAASPDGGKCSLKGTLINRRKGLSGMF